MPAAAAIAAQVARSATIKRASSFGVLVSGRMPKVASFVGHVRAREIGARQFAGDHRRFWKML